MAWSAPMTAVTGSVFTAAQFNQYVRDNLNMTEAAQAAYPAHLLVTTGANGVTFRAPLMERVNSYEDTASAAYGDLGTPGPSIAATTGTKVLASFGADTRNSNAGLGSRVSYEVSGATFQGAADANSFGIESGNANDYYQGTWTTVNATLNPGLNLFEVKYRTTAGGGVSTFGRRTLSIVPF